MSCAARREKMILTDALLSADPFNSMVSLINFEPPVTRRVEPLNLSQVQGSRCLI